MKARRLIKAAAAQALSREAPREIQIWNAGPNPTDYGVHKWTNRSVGEVLARYKSRGNPLLIDVEHNGAKTKDGEPATTGGYARLEVRAGVPWLVFDWSDYAREQIRTGERRFLSPEYDIDKNTGEILALYRVSLVADPGTHRARMLAAAMQKETRMDLATVLAAFSAALAAEDPAVAKESALKLVSELQGATGGGDAGGTDDGGTAAPVDAGADEGAGVGDGGDEEEDDRPKSIAAAAKPPAPVATTAPAPTAPTDRVAAAAAGAVLTVNNATRDHLIATQGDRLDPSIRRWASSQPLDVVRGLLDAAPAKDVARKRASATVGVDGLGLTERERQKCQARGIDPAKYAANKARSFGGGN